MIQSEFLIVLISFIISMIAFLAVLVKSLQSPLLEAKIFSLGFGFMVLITGLYLPSTLLYSSNGMDSYNFFGLYQGSMGFFAVQCSYLTGSIGFLFIAYALLLPNYEPNYRSLTSLSVLTAFSTAIGFTLFFTVRQVVKDEIQASFSDPLAYIAITLLAFITIYVIIYRIKEIQRVQTQRSSIFTTPLFLLVISSLILGTILALIIPTINPELIPAYTFNLPLSLALLLFSIAYVKDTVFLFITPITLDSFVCIQKTSGLPLYSISTEGDENAETLIAGIFQALNISLTEIVQSKKGLERIRYGDKTALIVTGKYVISIIFTSKVNFILSKISKHMTNNFEHKYGHLLEKENSIFNQNDFKSFEDIYHKYSLYFS